jgi:hypothetical protein
LLLWVLVWRGVIRRSIRRRANAVVVVQHVEQGAHWLAVARAIVSGLRREGERARVLRIKRLTHGIDVVDEEEVLTELVQQEAEIHWTKEIECFFQWNLQNEKLNPQ